MLWEISRLIITIGSGMKDRVYLWQNRNLTKSPGRNLMRKPGSFPAGHKVEYTYPDENFHQEKVVYERINGELVEVSREPYEMKG